MAKKPRKVVRDKKTGVPKKYLSGVKGTKRRKLAMVTKQIARLYREGKRIPKSLLDRKIKLGRKK